MLPFLYCTGCDSCQTTDPSARFNVIVASSLDTSKDTPSFTAIVYTPASFVTVGVGFEYSFDESLC